MHGALTKRGRGGREAPSLSVHARRARAGNGISLRSLAVGVTVRPSPRRRLDQRVDRKRWESQPGPSPRRRLDQRVDRKRWESRSGPSPRRRLNQRVDLKYLWMPQRAVRRRFSGTVRARPHSGRSTTTRAGAIRNRAHPPLHTDQIFEGGGTCTETNTDRGLRIDQGISGSRAGDGKGARGHGTPAGGRALPGAGGPRRVEVRAQHVLVPHLGARS